MVNHAKHPNCQFFVTSYGGLEMFAKRCIPAGTELTLDYRQAARVNPQAPSFMRQLREMSTSESLAKAPESPSDRTEEHPEGTVATQPWRPPYEAR